MGRFVVGLIALLLASCGHEPRICSEARPHFDKFVKEAESRNKKISFSGLTVEIANLKGKERAHCEEFTFSKVVRLDEFHWKNSTETERDLMVFHELGHCVLNRSHTKDFMVGKVPSFLYPVSIMHETGVIARSYQELRSYYLDELFR